MIDPVGEVCRHCGRRIWLVVTRTNGAYWRDNTRARNYRFRFCWDEGEGKQEHQPTRPDFSDRAAVEEWLG